MAMIGSIDRDGNIGSYRNLVAIDQNGLVAEVPRHALPGYDHRQRLLILEVAPMPDDLRDELAASVRRARVVREVATHDRDRTEWVTAAAFTAMFGAWDAGSDAPHAERMTAGADLGRPEATGETLAQLLARWGDEPEVVIAPEGTLYVWRSVDAKSRSLFAAPPWLLWL